MLERIGKSLPSLLALRKVLSVFAALFVIATFALFLEVLLSGEAPPSLGKKPVRVPASSTGHRSDCESGSKAHLRLVVSKFDPRSETVTIDARLCFSSEVFTHLYVAAKGGHRQAVLTPSGHLIARYASWPVTIIYESEGGEELSRSTSTSLGVLFNRTTNLPVFSSWVSLGKLILPVFATPQKYPFDRYGLQDTFATADPNFNLFYCAKRSACEEFVLPTTAKIYAESNLAPFEISASYLTQEGLPTVTLRMERTITKRIYVVVVVLIPLYLGLLLLLFLATGPIRETDTAILGIGAVLLAILPIRLVLVPADIDELTLVDYWLAVEMSALAALAAFGAWRALGNDSAGEPPPPRSPEKSISA